MIRTPCTYKIIVVFYKKISNKAFHPAGNCYNGEDIITFLSSTDQLVRKKDRI